MNTTFAFLAESVLDVCRLLQTGDLGAETVECTIVRDTEPGGGVVPGVYCELTLSYVALEDLRRQMGEVDEWHLMDGTVIPVETSQWPPITARDRAAEHLERLMEWLDDAFDTPL